MNFAFSKEFATCWETTASGIETKQCGPNGVKTCEFVIVFAFIVLNEFGGALTGAAAVGRAADPIEEWDGLIVCLIIIRDFDGDDSAVEFEQTALSQVAEGDFIFGVLVVELASVGNEILETRE